MKLLDITNMNVYRNNEFIANTKNIEDYGLAFTEELMLKARIKRAFFALTTCNSQLYVFIDDGNRYEFKF